MIRFKFILIGLLLSLGVSGQNFFWSHTGEVSPFYFSASGGLNTSAANSITIYAPFPSGISSGDLLIFVAWLKDDDTFGSFSPNSGDNWTTVNALNIDKDTYIGVFAKVADGTESGNTFVTHARNPNFGGAGIVFLYKSLSGSLSFSNNSITRNAASTGVSYVSPSISVGDAGIAIVASDGNYPISKSVGSYVLDHTENTPDNSGFAVAICSVIGDGTTESISLTWGTNVKTSLAVFTLTY